MQKFQIEMDGECKFFGENNSENVCFGKLFVMRRVNDAIGEELAWLILGKVMGVTWQLGGMGVL